MYVVSPMHPLLLLWNLSALAADPREELLASYADTPSTADHVLVLDVGGLAEDQRAPLRTALGAFAQRMDPQDRLAVITVSDAAVVDLPLSVVDDSTRAGLVAQLEALPLVGGEHSDLGAGLAAARDLIRAPGGSPLVVVTMVSDFCHSAPVDSPFALPGTEGCGQIRGLADLGASFDALAVERPIVPIAATLGRVNADGRSAFFKAISRGESLEFDPAEPTTLVDRYQEGLPWRRLKALVRRELDDYEVSAEVVPSEGARVRVNLKSGFKHLGVSLSGVAFSDKSLSPVRKQVKLAPDGEVEFEVVDAEPPLSPIPRTRTLVFDGYISANASLEPRAALSRLGVAAGKGQVRIPIRVEWTQSYGPPPWALAVGLLVGLGGVAAWARRRAPQRAG